MLKREFLTYPLMIIVQSNQRMRQWKTFLEIESEEKNIYQGVLLSPDGCFCETSCNEQQQVCGHSKAVETIDSCHFAQRCYIYNQPSYN